MLLIRMASRNKSALLAAVALGLLATAWFYLLGRSRWLDRDEGMYALAAELVTNGRQPWRDFLYPQAPLYPYLLAPFADGLEGLRVVPGAIGGLAVAILAWFLAARWSVTTAVWACLVWSTCWYCASWMPTIKTQAPAICLSLATSAAVVVGASVTSRKFLWLTAAGLILGLATLVKVPCLVVAVASVAWLILNRRNWLSTLCDCAVLLVVAAIIIGVGVFLSGASWNQALFNLVYFHNHPLENGLEQHLDVLRFWIKDTHAVMLFVLGFGGCLYRFGRPGPLHDKDHLFAGLVAVLLTTAYVCARTPQKQYLAFAAPFWVWAAAPLWHRLALWRPLTDWRSLTALIAWAAFSLLAYWQEITVSPFVGQDFFAPAQVDEVRGYLRSSFPSGSEVISIWPGYLVGTGHHPMPGLESGFSFKVADRLETDRRRSLHVVGWDEVLARIQEGVPIALVFTREDVGRFKISPQLLGPRYVLDFRTGAVAVFKRQDD